MPFTIQQLPVYWRVKNSTHSHSRIQEKHDISISIDSSSLRVKQDINQEIREMLNAIYREDENIGYIQDENSLASPYRDDLLKLILRTIGDVNGISILEIGCGGCTLLENLAKLGADVTGLDPSPFAQRAAKEKGISLIPDFFSPNLINSNYDIVYFSDVLEHVENPVTFLEEIKSCVQKTTKIIIAVPDASAEIASGDFSMLMHQHISYFTKTSLFNTISMSGLSVKSIERAGYGGSLYAIAEISHHNETPQKASNDSDLYIKKSNQAAELFSKFFKNLMFSSAKIYCYVPLRAIPYLCKIGELDNKKIHFIDDTPFWENMYIDGTSHKIQPLNRLSIGKDDSVLIFSNTFGEVIKSKVQSLRSSCKSVITLSDIIYDK